MEQFFVMFRNLFIALLNLLNFNLVVGQFTFSFLGFITVCLFVSMIVNTFWKGGKA